MIVFSAGVSSRMASRSHIPTSHPAPVDVKVLSRRFRLPIADVSQASAQAVALVPEKWARRFHIVPLSATAQELVIATADPLDVDCERTLGFATGRHVRLALADPHDIAQRIDEAEPEVIGIDLEPVGGAQPVRPDGGKQR